jgi:hypothetical protein
VLKPGGRLVVSLLTGRERVNAIHAQHQESALHQDQMPTAEQLGAQLAERGWQVVESEDTSEIFLLTAIKEQSD